MDGIAFRCRCFDCIGNFPLVAHYRLEIACPHVSRFISTDSTIGMVFYSLYAALLHLALMLSPLILPTIAIHIYNKSLQDGTSTKIESELPFIAVRPRIHKHYIRIVFYHKLLN